jgi:hypothetical protein
MLLLIMCVCVCVCVFVCVRVCVCTAKIHFLKAGVGGEHRSRSSEGGREGSGEQMLVLSAQEIKCVLRERGVSERELLKWSDRH